MTLIPKTTPIPFLAFNLERNQKRNTLNYFKLLMLFMKSIFFLCCCDEHLNAKDSALVYRQYLFHLILNEGDGGIGRDDKRRTLYFLYAHFLGLFSHRQHNKKIYSLVFRFCHNNLKYTH